MELKFETVGDLKALLARFPDSQPVVLSQDPEGNGFGRLSDWSEQMVDPDDYRPDQIWPTEDERLDPDSDYTDEDEAPEGSVRALVLWPV